MAGALVSIALGKLKDFALEKFKDYAWEKFKDKADQELSMFADAPRELEKLSSTLQSIQACLSDAERRQVGDDNVKQWLSRLRLVAYDMEDLVEDWLISSLGDQEGNEDDGNRRKKPRLSFTNHVAYRCKVAHDIKDIKERLDQIDVERKMFGFRSSAQGGDERRPAGIQRLTTSLMDESETFVGRENDKGTIIDKLVSGISREDRGRIQVVAVVGIGGLGKTTLARQIYNDPSVRNNFDTALYWVCVSETFDVIKLTKDIIEEVTSKNTTLSGLNALQNELLKSLRGKRFLLVLDDVWNDDTDKWNVFRCPLNSGAQGSRILVTTRGQKVAETMKATYIHELQGLSDDDSWEVFRSRAFAERTLEECSKLENVGRQIMSKCRGVPLAITVIGSAMSSKRTMVDWQNVLASEMWSLRDAKNKILPALWLSYSNLPSQLKQCFTYCSIFPKDWELGKDILVRLWAAQGFILSDGNRDIEDIGADYFDDLVAWSMFQEVGENSEGKITCKIHDLLHDLAESIAKDEIYTFIKKSEPCPIDSSNVRHSFLSFIGYTDGDFNKIQITLGRATKLRTLFLDHLHQIDEFNVDIFRQARFVRALVVSDVEIEMWTDNAILELPKVIDDMKHLRYLDLSGLGIVELPESVCDLRKLHRLSLNDCTTLKKLPRGIGVMVSLRHLEIEWTCWLEYLPKGLGRISGLQSLSKFIVGGGDKGEGCGIDELQPLNSLQGTLKIVHLERVSSREEAEKAELWKKQHLGRLVLRMLGELEDDDDYYDDNHDHDDAETGTIDGVLEGLRPDENLEELELYFFTGSKLPSWMDRMRRLQKLVLRGGPIFERVPHLPNLKEFEIWELRNEILPAEGWERLVALQILSISHCKELKCLPEGLTQVPLENLSISFCNKLESVPAGLGQLQSLENLSFSYCGKLELVPARLGQLQKLKSLGVGESKVLRCLPDSIGELESLEILYIRALYKLESLLVSLCQLKKLKTLVVGGLQMLRCLPDSIGQLESLERLDLQSFKRLDSLPVSLGQLKKLKSLKVCYLDVLTRLPDSVGQLESLESLLIDSCRKLESLPQGVRHLPHLQSLTINSCPLVTERYKREGGVDWPNISHIPNIVINHETIQ